jgi:hypothetical protein
VNISNMYLSSNTIIKTLFGITGSPRLLFWCFESAYGRQRPILWKMHRRVRRYRSRILNRQTQRLGTDRSYRL